MGLKWHTSMAGSTDSPCRLSDGMPNVTRNLTAEPLRPIGQQAPDHNRRTRYPPTLRQPNNAVRNPPRPAFPIDSHQHRRSARFFFNMLLTSDTEIGSRLAEKRHGGR